MFPVFVVILLSVVSVVRSLPCGGIQNVYVCHPRDPTFFQICIGDTQYTMKCPGGLHFNRRTQTCDWPRNANCRTQFTPPPPPTTTRRIVIPSATPSRRHRNHSQRIIRYDESKTNRQGKVVVSRIHNDSQHRYENSNQKITYKNPYLSKNPYTKRFRYKHKHFNAFNSVAVATGPKKVKPANNRERNVVDDLYSKSGKRNDVTSLNVSSGHADKWSLAHNYPWWAAKSSTTAAMMSRNAQKVISTTPRGYSPRRSYGHRRHGTVNSPAAGGPMNRLSSSLKPQPRKRQQASPQMHPVKLNDEDSQQSRQKNARKAVRKTVVL